MRKIVCLALAAALLVVSGCAFAQTADKHYKVAFANPSLEISLPGEETKQVSLSGLETSFSRGKTSDGMGYAFDLSVSGTSAVRAIVTQNAERILACVQGMKNALSFPVGASEKAEVKDIDLSSLLKFTEAFNFVDEGEDTQEFMYGAVLTANKTSLRLDSKQLDDIVDSMASMCSAAGFDEEGLKSIDKSVAVDIWTTADYKYLKLEAEIAAANCDQSVKIPISLQGKANDNGSVDITATMTESDATMGVNAHISPDEKHPLRPSMNVQIGVTTNEDEQEVLHASFITGCGHTDDATTSAVSFEFEAMGEKVFKALGSKKETPAQTTYTFKAGLNDELSVYCATEPYEDETGKGDKGYIDIDVTGEDFSVCVKSDLSMGVIDGALDTGDIENLEIIEASDCGEDDLNTVKTDLYIIAIRAIGVLTDIPEVSELINGALAA